MNDAMARHILAAVDRGRDTPFAVCYICNRPVTIDHGAVYHAGRGWRHTLTSSSYCLAAPATTSTPTTPPAPWVEAAAARNARRQKSRQQQEEDFGTAAGMPFLGLATFLAAAAAGSFFLFRPALLRRVEKEKKWVFVDPATRLQEIPMPLNPDSLPRVSQALVTIEEAQQRLYAACRLLSSVDGLASECTHLARLGDLVKHRWHHLERNAAARTADGASANRLCPRPGIYDA